MSFFKGFSHPAKALLLRDLAKPEVLQGGFLHWQKGFCRRLFFPHNAKLKNICFLFHCLALCQGFFPQKKGFFFYLSLFAELFGLFKSLSRAAFFMLKAVFPKAFCVSKKAFVLREQNFFPKAFFSKEKKALLKHAGFAAALFFLLATSGCIQLSAEERHYCLDLTERSYAFVPECDSQGECFSSLESSLFDFDDSVFSPGVRTELQSYKNNVALSWLYFNKAKSNIDEIHSICAGSSSLGSLPQKVNDLMHNLGKAFESSDNANLESFLILQLERQDLQQQDVNLIKEEPLFLDFALLNSNLVEMPVESCSSETYRSTFRCLYIGEVQHFEELLKQSGFSYNLVSETTIGAAPNDLPQLDQAMFQFLDFLNDYLKTLNSFRRLQSMPAFQFLQSYNQFMGQNNSVLQRFAVLMENNALHRAALQQRSNELQQQVADELGSAEQSLDALLSKEYASFDENFLNELYAVLGQDSAIAAQQYSIQDLSQLEQKGRAELLQLQSRFGELVHLDFIKRLSIGKKAFELKELNIRVSSLQENLRYLSSEAVNGLLVLCDERIAVIEAKLAGSEMPSGNFLQAADLKARTEYKIKQFNSAGSDAKKLLICRDAVAEFNRFSLALSDFQQLASLQEESVGDCFSQLSEIFENTGTAIDLSDFSSRYKQLQAIETPYDDSAAVERRCSALLQEVEFFLGQNSSVSSLEEDFATASALMQTMRAINAKDSRIVSRQIVAGSESQFKYFSAFFYEGDLILSSALPVLNELQQQLQEFVLQLQESVKEAIVSFAEKNASISIEQTGENGSSAIIAAGFSNPFRQIDEQLELQVPSQKSVGSLIYATQNVQSIKGEDGALVVELSSFPVGQTMLRFSTSEIVSISESMRLLSAASDEAIFQKTIDIICEQPLPLLQVRTALIDSNEFSYTNIAVSADGRKLDAMLQGNTVSFMLPNCNAKHEATVLFTVLQPIEFNFVLLETTEDANSRIFSYEITVKNRLPLAELRDIDFVLPLQADAKSIKSIELLNAEGKAVKFSMLPNKKIAFSVQSLLPLQGITLFLGILTAKDVSSEPLAQPVISLADQPTNPAGITGSAKQAAEQTDKINSIESTIESAEEKLAELDKLFSAITEKDLIEAKYIPPITKSDLSKLRLSLNKLKAELSKKSVQDFISLSEKGDFDAAMGKAASFSGKLPELLLEAESVNSQLANAINAIKEDAFAAFNSTADLFNNTGGSSEAQQLLQKAKDAFDKEQYLAATTNAKKAAALILQSEGKGITGSSTEADIPTFIYPLIAAAGLVLFVRFKKQKIREEKASQIKRIARNW
jgi:hypothetical protein